LCRRKSKYRNQTISTTLTSASIRNWYIYCSRSFFISTELSSSCATVNKRIRQRDQTLLRFNRKAIRKSRPPSCIIHHISIVPSWICLLSGNVSIFFGTITAHRRASAIAIVPILNLYYILGNERKIIFTNKCFSCITIKIFFPTYWPTKNNCIWS